MKYIISGEQLKIVAVKRQYSLVSGQGWAVSQEQVIVLSLPLHFICIRRCEVTNFLCTWMTGWCPKTRGESLFLAKSCWEILLVLCKRYVHKFVMYITMIQHNPIINMFVLFSYCMQPTPLCILLWGAGEQKREYYFYMHNNLWSYLLQLLLSHCYVYNMGHKNNRGKSCKERCHIHNNYDIPVCSLCYHTVMYITCFTNSTM